MTLDGEAKLTTLGEVGMNGCTVADVARCHDVTRQQIHQWRRKMRRKGPEATVLLPA